MEGDSVQPVVRDTADSIESMDVRGAASIAAAAAEALEAQAAGSETGDPDAFRSEIEAAARVLLDTRPTAVSLPNAIRYVRHRMDGTTVPELRSSVVDATTRFVDRLERAQTTIGQIGANRLRDGDTIMTHCHSTDVLACVEAAVDQGKSISAYVKETRPRNQGLLTAAALDDLDVPVTLIVDSAAGRYLGEVDHVLVGADSIAADGAVINKIGTHGLAVLARDRGVPFVVAAQTIKLHPETLTGHTVDIEMRSEAEVIDPSNREDLGQINVSNPAFDVTPPRHVDAILTESGQFPPESIVMLIRELYGDGDDVLPVPDGPVDAAE